MTELRASAERIRSEAHDPQAQARLDRSACPHGIGMTFAKPARMRLRRILLALTIAMPGLLPAHSLAQAPSGITGRGMIVIDSRWNDGPYQQVASGSENTIGLRTDGTIVVWGINSSNECAVPPMPCK